MISDEAIESAKGAAYMRYGLKPGASYIRAILEAAAPHMKLRELLQGVQREIDEAKTMTDILVDHQRKNSSGCLCGWAKLGYSHPEHQADALSAAGFGMVTK